MSVRSWLLGLAVTGAVLSAAAPAQADITAFAGFHVSPSGRPTAGFAVGVTILVVGFEFEYAGIKGNEDDLVPGLQSYMFNGLIQTPPLGAVQLYGTIGAGFYQERLLDLQESSWGTNLGGGAKITLAGPFRLRLDYRWTSLKGTPIQTSYQRIYAGINLRF